MEVYVTIVKYGDPYGTKLTEVWLDKKAAKNRCRMPLYHSGSAFDVESYKLYKVQLTVPWEVGGNRDETEMEGQKVLHDFEVKGENRNEM